MDKHKHDRGFTLIELMIVIVVIGILSVITIVSYSGVQLRARNAARVEIASQIKHAILAAVSLGDDVEGALTPPSGTSFYASCFSNNLPDVNNDGYGDCDLWGSSPIVSELPGFTSLMNGVASAPDASSLKPITVKGEDTMYAPIIYLAPINDNNNDKAIVMEYHLEGYNQNCGLTPPLRYVPDASYYTDLQGLDNSGHYTQDQNATLCIVRIT